DSCRCIGIDGQEGQTMVKVGGKMQGPGPRAVAAPGTTAGTRTAPGTTPRPGASRAGATLTRACAKRERLRRSPRTSRRGSLGGGRCTTPTPPAGVRITSWSPRAIPHARNTKIRSPASMTTTSAGASGRTSAACASEWRSRSSAGRSVAMAAWLTARPRDPWPAPLRSPRSAPLGRCCCSDPAPGDAPRVRGGVEGRRAERRGAVGAHSVGPRARPPLSAPCCQHRGS
ncbi:unnamed protein product, partial [Prorocentrum cordatum]